MKKKRLEESTFARARKGGGEEGQGECKRERETDRTRDQSVPKQVISVWVGGIIIICVLCAAYTPPPRPSKAPAGPKKTFIDQKKEGTVITYHTLPHPNPTSKKKRCFSFHVFHIIPPTHPSTPPKNTTKRALCFSFLVSFFSSLIAGTASLNVLHYILLPSPTHQPTNSTHPTPHTHPLSLSTTSLH